MKKLILTSLALSFISSNVFAFAKIEDYRATCETRRVILDSETNLPKSRISNFVMNSRIHISQDEMSETEIYEYVSQSTNGEENETSAEDNGLAQITHTKLNVTDLKTVVVDNVEILEYNDAGEVTGTEKSVFTMESVWRTLEKTEDRKVALRISHKADGVESKEQILRTKMMDKNGVDFTVVKMSLNPQDAVRADGSKLLHFSQTCQFKRTN